MYDSKILENQNWLTVYNIANNEGHGIPDDEIV